MSDQHACSDDSAIAHGDCIEFSLVSTLYRTVIFTDSAVDLIHYDQYRTCCVRTAHSVRSENELISRTYSYENPPDFELSACMQ